MFGCCGWFTNDSGIYASAAAVDKASIASMSFVPTQDEIGSLIQQASLAEVERAAGRRGPLLSKLHTLPGKVGLCPDTLNPNDTVLAQMGAKFEPIDCSKTGMTIIPDRNMCFGGGSNGPNGVLVDCQNKFGPNRMNLFYKDLQATKQLLEAYLTFRNDNLAQIFSCFVDHLHRDAFLKDFKMDPTKDATLPEDLRVDYANLASMFKKVEVQARSGSLEECGIECVSFCQTWLRNGHGVGDAQFSVMSPHFQTRFFVSNGGSLRRCGVSEEEIQSYVRMIKHHDSRMELDYGGAAGQAFINMDGLLRSIQLLP